MDEKDLLTLALQVLGKIDTTASVTQEAVDRMAGINAQLIVLLKKADQQAANGRLQMQATMNQLKADHAQTLSIFSTPEALAGAMSGEVLDSARQIKRKTTIVTTGRDPAAKRKRDDEITLVSIPLPHGGRRAFRLNRKLVKLIYLLLGLFGYWLAKKIGVPLNAIE